MEIVRIAQKKLLSESFKDFPEFIRPNGGLSIAGGYALSLYYKYLEGIQRHLGRNFDDDRFGYESVVYSDIDFFRVGNDKNLSSNLFFEQNLPNHLSLMYSGKNISLERKSEHANTFNSSMGYLQFVSYKYDTMEDMFSNFDLSICNIAVNNFDFFASSDFIKTIESGEISLINKKFFSENRSLSELVYQTNRVGKYIMRLQDFFTLLGRDTKVTLSKDLSDAISRVIIDSERVEPSYWDKDDTFKFCSYYGTKSRVSGSTKREYGKLFDFNLQRILESMTSGLECAAFLINSDKRQIRNTAKQFIVNKA